MDWSHVRTLNGRTLRTTVQGKEFRITSVSESFITLVPTSGNKTPRPIPRSEIERLLALGLRRHELTPQRVREEFPASRNSSYLSAILQAIL